VDVVSLGAKSSYISSWIEEFIFPKRVINAGGGPKVDCMRREFDKRLLIKKILLNVSTASNDREQGKLS
jgi:hypothetical protein